MSRATFSSGSDVMQKNLKPLYLLLTFRVQLNEFILKGTLIARCALTIRVLIIRTIQVWQPAGQFIPKTQRYTHTHPVSIKLTHCNATLC